MGKEIYRTQPPEEEAITDGSWIETFSGAHVTPLNPKPDMIFMVDIVHALSNICRFTGHSKVFYSVAQHSILVSRLVSKTFIKEALLHDAAEAYLCDIARPVKRQIPAYGSIENHLKQIIFHKFNVTPYEHRSSSPEVSEADNTALIYEAAVLGLKWGIERLTPRIVLAIETAYADTACDYWPMPNDYMSPQQAESQYLKVIRDNFDISEQDFYGQLLHADNKRRMGGAHEAAGGKEKFLPSDGAFSS